MKKLIVALVISLVATSAFAEWKEIEPGVDYQQFLDRSMDVHVTRIDLTNEDIVITSTRETERGMRLSDFAKKNKAIVAINGGYYTDKMMPVGLAVGPCGPWEGTQDTSRWGVVAVGRSRAAIYSPSEVLEKPEEWMAAAVSGWPMLVNECRALTAKELPGSDVFTRAPHPRTAVGLSEDGKTLYFVVADGRREDVKGMTLAELGNFMAGELGVCSAINFDGGGSSAMWVEDAIVSRPSDGSERRVADHLAVVHVRDYRGCDKDVTNIAVSPDRASTPPAAAPAPTTSTATATSRPAGTTATTATTRASSPTSPNPPAGTAPPPPAKILPPPSALPGYPAPVPNPPSK